jgi:hypothetical protein
VPWGSARWTAGFGSGASGKASAQLQFAIIGDCM